MTSGRVPAFLAILVFALMAVRASASPLELEFPKPDLELSKNLDQAFKSLEERERAAWFDDSAPGGNKLELLLTGDELYRSRVELIFSARKSIYLSAYSFKNDGYSKEVINMLCYKKSKGVDVRILVDNIGANELRKLRDKYVGCKIPVLHYNEVKRWGLNHVLFSLHEKFLIADGERMIVGGSGYSNGYRTHSRKIDDWQDMDLRVDGPAACAAHKDFVLSWKDTVGMYLGTVLRFRQKWKDKNRWRIGEDELESCEPKVHGDAKALQIYSHPLFRGKKTPILDAYFDAIRASRSEITLYAPYFMPRRDFMDALIEAKAKRGVRVRILTNSIKSNDEPWANAGMLGLVGPLLEAGVEIYQWQHGNTIHRKGGVFDRRWGYVGSDNLNGRGQLWNTENVVFTDDEAVVGKLAAKLDEDLRGARLLTPELAVEQFNDLPWEVRKTFPIVRKYMQGTGPGAR